MKYLLVIFFFLSLTAQASTEWISGSASAYDYCDGNNFMFCSRQVERRAEEAGQRETAFRCQMRGGRMYSFSVHCNQSCYPNYLAPDAPRTHVECRASCSGPCEFPNP